MLELISALGELGSSWRFYTCLAIAALVIWLVYTIVLDEAARLVFAVPLTLLEFSAGFYWQARADSTAISPGKAK